MWGRDAVKSPARKSFQPSAGEQSEPLVAASRVVNESC